jgi:prepilin-type N-terminal cleavage/methylation domain-containing protein
MKMKTIMTIKRPRRGAFTLIELLVVIAVILILLGISLKMMSVVTRKSGIAKTLYVLEQTRNALEAYYATVGSYPNTTTNSYECCTGQSSAGFDASAKIKANEVYGLTYYLGYQPLPRAASWQKFVRNVNPAVISTVGSHTNGMINEVGFDGIMTTNSVMAIRDAWDHNIIYFPNATCDGYTLYSAGPDGNANTTIDNIGLDKNE